MEQDMTQGKPLSIILKFTLPLLVGNIFQQFYNMADTIIVGRFVGANALAAVGSTGTVMFLIIGFAQGITAGFTILTSQRYGAKDEKAVRQCGKRYPALCSCHNPYNRGRSEHHEASASPYEYTGGYFCRCVYLQHVDLQRSRCLYFL